MYRPFITLLLSSILLSSTARAHHANVACVGDSITAGVGAARGWAYPSQLQRMLGPTDYTVRNFGVSGATLLRHGDKPYDLKPAFKAALDFKPAIVILMLGTNDTKPQNWGPHQAEFETDYRWLIAQLQASNPAQKLFVCRPCWVAGAGKYGINEPVLEKELPIIDQIAASLHLDEIDMHGALEGHPEDFVDTVHPNNAGAALMAKAAYKAITGNAFQGEIPAPSPAANP
jgi:lysophospholipase L1-like esterase